MIVCSVEILDDHFSPVATICEIGLYPSVIEELDLIDPQVSVQAFVRNKWVTSWSNVLLVNGLGNHLLINNLWAKNYNVPCLEVVLTGDNGKWAIDKSDDTIRLEVLTFMQQSMMLSIDPNSRLSSNDYAKSKDSFLLLDDWCIDCHVTRWEEDPMSNGSYCNFAVGTLERHMDALAEPEWGGRLIFAGDGTVAEYLGSVHAALISGHEAAQKFFDGVGHIE